MNFPQTFGKNERLCGKTSVSALLGKGRWGASSCFKYCFYVSGKSDSSRILVSVPKKSFKRAVKRNLMKRRIREAYRTQKQLLGETPVDLMLVCGSSELLDYQSVRRIVADILTRIASVVEKSGEK